MGGGEEVLGDLTLHLASCLLWMTCQGLREPSDLYQSMAGRLGAGQVMFSLGVLVISLFLLPSREEPLSTEPPNDVWR